MNRLVLGIMMIVVAVFLGLSQNAKGSDESHVSGQQNVRMIEDSTIMGIRTALSARGYQNAGVTMSCMRDSIGRDYTIAVHHKKLLQEDTETIQALFAELEGCVYSMEGIEVQFVVER